MRSEGRAVIDVIDVFRVQFSLLPLLQQLEEILPSKCESVFYCTSDKSPNVKR